MFARRSPSKLVEAFARIFPVPYGIFGYALSLYQFFLFKDAPVALEHPALHSLGNALLH
jgi:hypothetical protein